MKKIELISTLLFWLLYAPVSYAIWIIKEMNALDVIIIFLIGILFNLLLLVFASLMLKQRRQKLRKQWARQIARELEEEMHTETSPVVLPLPPTSETPQENIEEELQEDSDLD